ncbi:hypothetical protein FRB91_008771 [Serendipita sp. 411]|nr:hypothetical protein FRB91_008771 [Serendipita sp. 411]
MPQLHSLLILGATGRVGAAVVFALRQRYPNLPITALLELGITVIHGDLENLGLVMDLASSADIVVNSALSESISLAQAIHIGLNNRRRGARKPILLHISRTALDLHHEDPRSLQLQTKPYDDVDTTEWMATPPETPSRLVDNEIMQAVYTSPFQAYIVAPTTILGRAQTPMPQRSHHISRLVQRALKERRLIFPGDGMNAGNGVHLQDVVKLCCGLIGNAMSPTYEPPPENPQFFFAASTEFCWSDVAVKVASKLYNRGLIASDHVYSAPVGRVPELW